MRPRLIATLLLVYFIGVGAGALLARRTSPWDYTTLRHGHTGPAVAVALTPDGKFAASAGVDGRALVWDLESLAPFRRIDLPSRQPTAISISDDATVVAVAFADQPTVVYSADGSSRPLVQGDRTSAVIAVSHRGQKIATIDDDDALRIWSADTGALDATGTANIGSDQIGTFPTITDLIWTDTDTVVMFLYPWQNAGIRASDGRFVSPFGSGRWNNGLTSVNVDGRVLQFNVRLVGGGFTDAHDWYEPVDREIALLVNVPAPTTTANGWTNMGTPAPARANDVASLPHFNPIIVGLPDGNLEMVAPHVKVNIERDPLFLLTFGLGVALAGWLLWMLAKPGESLAPSPAVREAIRTMPVETIRPPAGLRIVGWMFIVFGLLDAAGMVIGLTRRSFNLDFGVINILTGRRLMQYRNGWRIFALIQTWPGVLVVGLMAGAMMLDFGGLTMTAPKWLPVVPPRWAFGLFVAGMTAIEVYTLYILHHPDIVALFHARRGVGGAAPPDAATAVQP